MRNRNRRRANELRRKTAELKQTPLHMEGEAPHPLTGLPTKGQKDRAAERKRTYEWRYPYAPKYANHDGSYSS